jgi:hypothetical protein
MLVFEGSCTDGDLSRAPGHHLGASLVLASGAVHMLEKMGQWKEMVCGKGASAVAILYVDEGAGGGQQTVVDSSVGRHFKLLAQSMGGIAFGHMRVDGLLEQLAKEGVRFTQRFPVLHVYVNAKKVDQVGGGDIGAMESALLRFAGSPASLLGSGPSAPLQSAAFSQPRNATSSRPMRPAGTEEGYVTEIHSHAQFEEVLESAGATLVGAFLYAVLALACVDSFYSNPCNWGQPSLHLKKSAFSLVTKDRPDGSGGFHGAMVRAVQEDQGPL